MFGHGWMSIIITDRRMIPNLVGREPVSVFLLYTLEKLMLRSCLGSVFPPLVPLATNSICMLRPFTSAKSS